MAALTEAPGTATDGSVTFAVGDIAYALSPLTMRDLSELSRVCSRQRRVEPEFLAETFAEIKGHDEAAAREWLLAAYRDIVQAPPATMAEVCAWLGTVDGLPWLVRQLAARRAGYLPDIEPIRDALLAMSPAEFIAASNLLMPLLGQFGGGA